MFIVHVKSHRGCAYTQAKTIERTAGGGRGYIHKLVCLNFHLSVAYEGHPIGNGAFFIV